MIKHININTVNGKIRWSKLQYYIKDYSCYLLHRVDGFAVDESFYYDNDMPEALHRIQVFNFNSSINVAKDII